MAFKVPAEIFEHLGWYLLVLLYYALTRLEYPGDVETLASRERSPRLAQSVFLTLVKSDILGFV